MKTPLAWLNLVHNKTRTALAVAGVVFAVVLIFAQLGFLGSAETSATLVYDALDFDVLLRSPRYLHLVDSRTFPRARLYQAEAVPGVECVRPFCVASERWRNPHTGEGRVIVLLAVDPADPPFRPGELEEKSRLLTVPEYVLIDRLSRPEFGPADGRRFGDADVGAEVEVAQRRATIAGHFALGAGFAADGTAVIGDEGFFRSCPYLPRDEVNLGLVKLRGGADPAVVAAELRQKLPEDVEVLTRDAALRYEAGRWVRETSIGAIFQLGVAVALVVGAAIVYQVLSSDVANHLAEYATLKAMGYGGRYLAGVVVQQAVFFALLGFLPGVMLAEALYAVTRWAAGVPIAMTFGRIALVSLLSLAMCLVSALGAVRKVGTADPADLF